MGKNQPGTSKTQQEGHKKLEITDKLKVLCLHGYRQNADSFKSKLGSFRKFVGKYAEFTFITAPHQAPLLDGTPEDADISDQKSWWFNKDDGTFKGTNVGGPAFGFEESLKYVETIWEEQGPFQGLLGFSQGACFVGLLCGISHKSMTTIKPSFAVLSSGFTSGSLVHKNFYENTVEIPSLHIYGKNDDIIPHEMSEKLAAVFQDPEILTHQGGHYFPATAQQKTAYVTFFQDRLEEYLTAREFDAAPDTEPLAADSSS